MKIKILLLTLFLLVFGMEIRAQIVTNGDFETGDTEGWTVSDGSLSEQGDAISGDYSFIKLWGNSDLLISQVVAVDSGKDYTLTFDTDRAWDWIYVYAKIFDDATDELIAEVSTHLQEEQSGTADFVAPESGSARIEFSKSADEPGKIWIDNIAIEENLTDPDPSSSLITNGDFETGDLTGWDNLAENGFVQSAADIPEENAHQIIEGEYSYFKNWGNGDMISQIVELEPGKEYNLSYTGFLAWSWIYVHARVFDTSNSEKIAETNIHKQEALEGSLDFTAPESGYVEIRFVKWADSPGRAGVDKIVLEEINTTSVSELNNDISGNIDIYPNPSDGLFNLGVSDDLIGSDYQVYNILGSRISTGTVSDNHTIFDFTGYESGIYIFRLDSGNRSISKKISIR